jgi:SAM-dependent methyltransferase
MKGLYSRSQARPVGPKSSKQLAREWDRIAEKRLEQVEKHVDISREFVLLPSIWSLLPEGQLGRVVDVGCGTGQLTSLLAARATETVGVDASRVSIELARKRYGRGGTKARFVHSTIEDYAAGNPPSFDVAVANMVLMTMADLKSGLIAIAALLRDQGLFVFTITHPWFWPTYWGYDREGWFSYGKEIFIEAPFEISLAESLDVTTHVHRPLAAYVESLADSGLVMDSCLELMPEPGVEARYPTPWRFPRFLATRCVRIRSHAAG